MVEFTIREADTDVVYRFPNAEEVEVLGEGTVAAVFGVLRGDQPSALKIFYEQDDGNSTADIYAREKAALLDLSRQPANRRIGLVRMFGTTEAFRQSSAYSAMRPKFDRHGLRLSDFAISMERYQVSLKDYLEKPIGQFFPRGTQEFNEQRSGYQILRGMSFDQRVEAIVPILKMIAAGLINLQAITRIHLDVKPGNIFLLLGRAPQAVLGDFGGSRLSLGGHYGTRHYRSPEQKDFFDAALADNMRLEHGVATISISDPKFRDSIIGAGDTLRFSKQRRIGFTIQSVDSLGPNSDERRITLRPAGNRLDGQDWVGSIAQLEFNKEQTFGTDLFGLGALGFDLLTAGASPEHFYEYLRSEDKPGEELSKLVEKYRRVEENRVTNPSDINIFQALKIPATGEYAPERFVKFVLHCMMYRAPGCFFQRHRNNPEDAFDAAYKMLESLEGSGSSRNRLFFPTQPDIPTTSSGEFRHTISRLQQASRGARLTKGLLITSKLAHVVLEKLRDGQLAELFPENITTLMPAVGLVGDPTPGSVAYTLPEPRDEGSGIKGTPGWGEYIEDLIRDRIVGNFATDLTSPFVPIDIASMRRRINLIAVASVPRSSGQQAGEEQFPVRLQFLDWAVDGDYVRSGDFVRLELESDLVLCAVARDEKRGGDQTSAAIRVVASLSKKGDARVSDEIGPVEKSMASLLERMRDEPIRGLYYRRLRIGEYYRRLLAIYLYQAVFAGMNDFPQGLPITWWPRVQPLATTANATRPSTSDAVARPRDNSDPVTLKKVLEVLKKWGQRTRDAKFDESSEGWLDLYLRCVHAIRDLIVDGDANAVKSDFDRISKFRGDLRTISTRITELATDPALNAADLDAFLPRERLAGIDHALEQVDFRLKATAQAFALAR